MKKAKTKWEMFELCVGWLFLGPMIVIFSPLLLLLWVMCCIGKATGDDDGGGLY